MKRDETFDIDYLYKLSLWESEWEGERRQKDNTHCREVEDGVGDAAMFSFRRFKSQWRKKKKSPKKKTLKKKSESSVRRSCCCWTLKEKILYWKRGTHAAYFQQRLAVADWLNAMRCKGEELSWEEWEKDLHSSAAAAAEDSKRRYRQSVCLTVWLSEWLAELHWKSKAGRRNWCWCSSSSSYDRLETLATEWRRLIGGNGGSRGEK